MLRLFRNDSNKIPEGITREIAVRVLSAIWPQLELVMERMDAAELRGYLRAQLQPWICAELQKLTTERLICQTQVRELTTRVEASAIHTVLAAVNALPTISLPVPHTTTRTAA